MNQKLKPLSRVAIILTGIIGMATAYADLMGSLKSASEQLSSNTASTSGANSSSLLTGALGSLMGGNAQTLQSTSSANIGGVLSYCVQNNVLAAGNQKVESVKDALLNKLGTQTESQSYQNGLNGILDLQGKDDVNLNNLGSMTSDMKAKIKTKVCGMVLDQAKKIV
ncbi:DUF2501 domain-containing protein [Hafnia paralvei]|uniref:DUF2501 domain-containing protein n=1 Tax=Hafnia paralvei TaxID=546367 RepID=UPI001D19054D|nr:DUF2501 domain-containing protein [Hafnia paralvei]